ncbi:MAG: FAD-binding oxidoreductase, partial [Gemmatimonadaceae bacterium]
MSRPNGTTVPARASARTEERPLQPRDTADVREMVREAGNRTAPLRIRAGGSWMDAGCPVEPCTELDLSRLRGIREYTPGDLTLTAGPATTLAEIEDATGSHGQWLLLDPVGGALGTLGASLATASCGPLAASGGQPRDLTLGVEFVDGRGTVVRGGGRVVKNVAGFDLVRLLVGSWGTLGVITEVTVRLRALPECERTVAVPAPADRETLATLLRALRS